MANDGSVVIDIEGDSSKFQKALSKLGSVASGALKGLGVASAAAASAVVAVGTAAVTAYADYEQLVGGVGKIFDQMDSSIILKDSQDAWKNLNMSASEYLATIVDVGANFASTMGDEKGYEAAKRGMQAISDYASGTGKDVDLLSEKFTMITRSTSSYQSIADQFSGILPATSKDFLAQAQACGYLSDSYKKLTDVPIAEYQEAVTLMLEKGVADLNLTGNTAAETANTLSGSLAATRASWQNLLVGMADDTQDFDALIDTFVESVTALGDNLLPRIGIVLDGIVSLITALGPKIAEELPSLIESFLPGLIEGVLAIGSSVIAVLPELATTIATTTLNSLYEAFGVSDFSGLIGVLTEKIASIDWQGLGNSVSDFLASIDWAGVVSSVFTAIGAAFGALGAFLVGLFEDGWNAVCEYLGGWISDAEEMGLSAAEGLLAGILAGIADIAGWIVTNVFVPFIDGFKTAFGIASPSKVMQEQGQYIMEGLLEGISNLIPDLLQSTSEILRTIWDEITNTDWWSLGSDIISGIASGVSGAVGTLADAAWNVAQNALSTIKSALGINSPSKVFAKEVGRWIPPGIGEGAEDAMPELNAEMRRSLAHTIDDASAAVASEVGGVSRRLASSGPTGGGGGDAQVVTNENGVTVIIYYSGAGDSEDIKKLGRQIGAETSRELRRKGLPKT